MANPLEGKSVLVTGGTGSFGSAFVRHALNHGARRVVVFSRDELKQAQMASVLGDERLRFFIGSVTDSDRLALAMQGIDVVVHAAAMKRIEVCEANPWEAVQVNVVGTHLVAQEAIRAGVSRCVFLSTDKSPAAHTLYGSTKFTAERLWVNSNVYAGAGPTRLSAVRYGNVLGSRGSVLDIFRAQVKAGGPVKVTHPDATRFWMTIAQAVDLVVLALSDMQGGEVYVAKVPSAPIMRLVDAVCDESRVTTLRGTLVTGLRPNERLHETLISQDEARSTCDFDTHYVIYPDSTPWSSNVLRFHGRDVPADFSYRSDTNPDQLDVAAMRELIAA